MFLQDIADACARHAVSQGLLVLEDSDAFCSMPSLEALTPMLHAIALRTSRNGWAVVLPNQTAWSIADLLLEGFARGAFEYECFTVETDAVDWLESRHVRKPPGLATIISVG